MSRDALIVGINRYQYLPDLKAPAVDAEAIAQRLEEDGEFTTLYRLPERITQGETKKPQVSDTHSVSREQLEQSLEQLFLPGSSQAPETALFYFSGHGIPDQKGFDKGYLATSDTNPKQSRSGVSLRWLQWLLSESPIKQQIIWLDCCHSGSLLVNVGAANPGHGESKDRCFIASSRDFEKSWEDLNSNYSVLTNALLDGLDPSRLPGRWIDTFALVDYVNQALKRELQTLVCTHFGEAINLTHNWQEQGEPTCESTVDRGICPYKGLEYFDCNDEDPKYFFGREPLVGQILDQVRTSNFIALVGASGNGKSSVLRAGLLHQLKLGRCISGSDQWQIRIVRPDREPIKNLAQAFVEDGLSDVNRALELRKITGLLNEGTAGLQQLAQASTAPRTVLVIDQFEEVFTRCDAPEEREKFFAGLMGALEDADEKLCLIIAMRADFIVKCMEQEYSGLARWIDKHQVSILPMKADELKAAICQPAQQVNLQIESALVTDILNDIEGAPGSLPLLQYTLKTLWQKRQNNQLTLASYQGLGGVQGTLDQRATAIYKSFDEAEQQTVRHIFQQLTQLGEGTEDTRRRVFQDDLVAEPKHPAKRVEQVITRLSSKENRLIVTSEVVSKSDLSFRMSIVDVAHEALIRHWRLLRQWIEPDRDLLRKQRRIEANAIAWRNQDENFGYLMQGLPLNEAIQFDQEQAKTFPVSKNGKEFIRQSLRQQRLKHRKIGTFLVIPVIIVLIIFEHMIREIGIQQDYKYAPLARKNNSEQTDSVESLVEGCRTNENSQLPPYILERLFGNCRPLVRAQLRSALLEEADLRNSNLKESDLTSAKLNQAKLSNADLSSANLSEAKLIHAKLYKADLRNAKLRDAKLYKTDLRNAKLRDAKLQKADVSNSHLEQSDLTKAKLYKADLHNTNLSDAKLNNADLHNANLSDAKLCNTKLVNADLYDAKLVNADLYNAKLANAELRNADLRSANLSSADLSNADLRNSIFLNTDLRETKNLEQAQLKVQNPPLICNSLLPQSIDKNIRDRDCDKLAAVLHERYPFEFSSLDKAETYVAEQRQRKWD